MPFTPPANPFNGQADKNADHGITHPATTSVAVIMAAGASRRFGADDKRLATLPDGRHLLAATVALVTTAFPALRVVLREDDDPQALGLSADTPIIRTAHASEGLGASIRDAFIALQGDDDLIDMQAAAILLGDMPALRPETLEALQRQITRQCIVRPVQAGRPGHPVLFGRAFWSELAALGGKNRYNEEGENLKDEGARSVIRANREYAIELAVDDPGIHLDIDHSTDLRRLS
ncbi:nucleotidyltransferase family protein [Onishia niordana]|uniref:nucleotidyltransferase family protein n=1 Tax=Onishia niordana TaxID=2508711 RepID=UPI0010A02E91|nr:nucleotidyltransferase family protein [Halomonas niordiana]